jgi:signal transduction histidine kinase
VIGLRDSTRRPDHRSGAGEFVSATTLDTALATAILARMRSPAGDTLTREIEVADARYLVVRTKLANAGSATFVRSIAQELAVLPALRRTAAIASTAAVAVALLLAAWLSRRISRPVRQLAAAAEAIGAGSFDTVLPESRLSEVATVYERFHEMREALRSRLVQLRESNEALQERSARLQALQADLLQRERLAAAGRLVAQLAHEIRNPVASLRNCLEVVRRRLANDPEGLEFADLAINELLRMHELAEQMRDVSRPRPGAPALCAPVTTARDVVRLSPRASRRGARERQRRSAVCGDRR